MRVIQNTNTNYDLQCAPMQGADTVIYERLAQNNSTNQQIKGVTRQQMEEFGSAGLRTLCLAYAEVSMDFYDRY